MKVITRRAPAHACHKAMPGKSLACTCIRGQGIGIAKAIVSLTLFHEGRIFITNQFKQHNLKKLEP